MDIIEASKQSTLKHKAEVNMLAIKLIQKISERAEAHDDSKLTSPEIEIFAEHTPKLADMEYNSEEYKQTLKDMEVALKHHYATNRHHPEHHEQGIGDFNIIDLIEYCCDIKAASLRQNTGNVLTSLKANQSRFGYSDDLASIIKNTMVMMELL